ncbi:hypothetical protein SUNI508_11775 [Seiridium unicorne]|uniref:Uncharacterized protein n=1 Tax=Seiridium unicorne TaxID=138068 RepID=A0ABR2UGR9_9PEZI
MRLPYRIPVPVRPRNSGQQGPNTTAIIVGVTVAFGFLAIVVCVHYIRRRNQNKKKGSSKRRGYSRAAGNEDSSGNTGRPSRARGAGASGPATINNNETVTVDRNTSVRSVLTLPAYRTKANDNEQVLGREGERDGVDVVVEMPTAEDHEALREDEMETMYQIRVARRNQIAEREERRQQRREARARGDQVALRELNERARASSSSTIVNDLRDDQLRIKNQRERAVSSVSYEGLGVARHDGTRLRANSQESERVGLLSDAASISLSTRSPSALSHRRDRSASSVLSFDSAQDFQSPGHPGSGATTPRRLSAQHTTGTAGSSPEIIGEADLGETGMPLQDPPGYDDVSLDDARSGATTPVNFNEPPPHYPGPAQERDHRLSLQVAGMVDNAGADGDLSTRSSATLSRNSSSSSTRPTPFPRLPSLSLEGIPQIVVEPSSAYPRDRSTDR